MGVMGVIRQKHGVLCPGQQEVEERASGPNGVEWQRGEIMEMMDSGSMVENWMSWGSRESNSGETMCIVHLNFNTRELAWLLEDGDQPYRPSYYTHENWRY